MQEIMRVNEGLEQKIDSLKRELAGTNDLLNEKEKSIGSASAPRDKELKTMEQKMKEIRASEGTAKADINQLREQLKAARAEIERADEAYEALKARVKVVATELKDHRAECRTIGLTLGEMTEANEQLQIQLKFYESQLGDRDRNQTEKDEEMDHLKDKIKQLEEELKEADKKIQQRDMVGEKALAAYKKKAQTSMSIANARTAAAIQAKEDAEMDSQGARSAAEEALQRAKEAEATGIAALSEAREYVKEMEEERSGLVQRANDALEELEKVRNSFAESMAESEAARPLTSKDRLSSEIQDLQAQLRLERNHISELQQEVRDFQTVSAIGILTMGGSVRWSQMHVIAHQWNLRFIFTHQKTHLTVQKLSN
jgi:chromosome segregation ATPase